MNKHISRIKHSYQTRLKIMVDSLEEYMPVEVSYTKPDGGMFIWVTLPEYLDAFDILDKAKKNGVIFVPGSEFYIDGKGKNTMRLNFTNSTESEIRKGINCLSNIIKEVL
ncbi:aminotransferase class I/II-fold pyridoxal phosphate-dependent enzyme [Vagococcus bubulae]|nr:aminotransferase class I/II-fold pyridoxal phosphate-dependent enzyme [Vagococcus bubulae]